jgi:calcineurin-like phosphoesterase
VKKFKTGMPVRLNVREKEIRLDAAVITYELATGKAVAVEPVHRMYKEEDFK